MVYLSNKYVTNYLMAYTDEDKTLQTSKFLQSHHYLALQ